jgi:hypothetical protein
MDNFIEVYNVFDKEFCNKIITLFNNYDEMGFTVNRQEHDKAPTIEKKDKAIFLPQTLEFPFHQTTGEIMNPFMESFWEKAYKEYAKKYGILNELGSHTFNIYTMKIQKTEPGEGYHRWHCESAQLDMCQRLLTWTLYLNDDFEAGETEFLYQHYRYKPKQGDVVIFPAAFTHTHRGNPPINGTKYIVTGWLEF